MLGTLRWLLPAVLPSILFGALLRYSARRRARLEPAAKLIATFALGAIAAVIAVFLEQRASALTGLDVRVSAVGQSGALIFVFFVLAPVQEVGKAAATWPSLMLAKVDEPYDGVAYAAASALGFAAVESGFVLHAHPAGGMWIARTLLALPAHVFCASLWGYALGRARRAKQSPVLFPGAFVAAIVLHGLYVHFVYGRGPGALFAATPLLPAMAAAAWLLARDLGERTERPSRAPSSRGRHSTQPPSLATVRAALRATEEPIRVGWILFGALVTFGAMIVGVAGGVVAAHALHVDLSTVDEHDLRAASPVLLLGLGLLASFPTSGWLIARAAAARSLLEPALAAVLALALTLVTLGFAAPVTVVFALALSPIAWLLSCLGAWIGRAA